MATISVKQGVIAGVNLAMASCAAGGDEFVNVDKRVLMIINASAAVTPTVTITPGSPPLGLTFAPIAFNVPGAGWYVFGPFPPQWFNDANNKIQVTYSAVTSLFISCIRI